tara:strand:- start:445 stop:618 length:174 start_codon:yes stop_codon:yes gene_type:complete
MLLYILGISYFVIGVLIGLRLTQLRKDMTYIRVSLEELEQAIDNNTWVVYDNDHGVH